MHVKFGVKWWHLQDFSFWFSIFKRQSFLTFTDLVDSCMVPRKANDIIREGTFWRFSFVLLNSLVEILYYKLSLVEMHIKSIFYLRMNSCEHFIFHIVLSEEHFNLFTKNNIFVAGEQFEMFSSENIWKSKTKNDLKNSIFWENKFQLFQSLYIWKCSQKFSADHSQKKQKIVPIMVHLEMFTNIFCG